MRLLPLLLIIGCVADPVATPDATPLPDAEETQCDEVDLAPSWLAEMQTEVVGKLSGAIPIATGVTLADRSTTINREHARNYIRQELEQMGYTALEHPFSGVSPGTNVYAQRLGTEPGLYVIGAHYDSVPQSPGANDNATGVAAVLAVARMLSVQQCQTRGLLFVFFDQEENGLVGSRAFAETLVQEGREVLGVYTLDQLGWDEDQDRRMEVELPAPGMLTQMRESIEAHGLGVELIATSTVGSDHTSFREKGFAAAGLTEEFVSGDTTPHYHLGSDLLETVDLAYLGSCTTVLAALLSDLSR